MPCIRVLTVFESNDEVCAVIGVICLFRKRSWSPETIHPWSQPRISPLTAPMITCVLVLTKNDSLGDLQNPPQKIQSGSLLLLQSRIPWIWPRLVCRLRGNSYTLANMASIGECSALLLALVSHWLGMLFDLIHYAFSLFKLLLPSLPRQLKTFACHMESITTEH